LIRSPSKKNVTTEAARITAMTAHVELPASQPTQKLAPDPSARDLRRGGHFMPDL
jgi:hypothetical protein